MTWRLFTLLALITSALASAGCSGLGQASDSARTAGETPPFISIGTAPWGGAFYSVGAAIADVLDAERDVGGWRHARAESTGGTLENLRRLENGDFEVAMANSSITYFAVRGEQGFERPYQVKSIMTLFPLIAMFVTRKDSGVESIADLKGKRVVVGPEGAGFEYFIRLILREHGVEYGDFDDVYAGMQTSVGYMQDENVSATFLGGGKVSPAITSAASTMDILLVPYGEEERTALVKRYPFFHPVTIPAETYRGQTEDFAGMKVGSAQLLVRADARDEFVYRVTKIIYEGRERIAETHAAGKSINAVNAVRYEGTEFHPGAIRYYQEIGIWPADERELKDD